MTISMGILFVIVLMFLMGILGFLVGCFWMKKTIFDEAMKELDADYNMALSDFIFKI